MTAINHVSNFSIRNQMIKDECCYSQIDAMTPENTAGKLLTITPDNIVTQSSDFIENKCYVADRLSFLDQLDRKDPSWRE